MKIGYARVSTTDQDYTGQVEALTAAGCDPVRHEKKSGTKVAGRDELNAILTFIRKGDTLVVTKIDRLARSVSDLCEIVATIQEKGADLIALEQPINTGTAAGKCFLQMLGVFAEFETAIRRNGNCKGSRKRNPPASTRDGHRRSTRMRSAVERRQASRSRL